MLPITCLFSKSTNALTKEYNINSRMNSFLYNNEDIHQWFREKYLTSEYSDYTSDRFVFVDRCNQIERELLLLIRDQFNGREVTCTDSFGRQIKGTIRVSLTRNYEGREIEHHVSMRGVNDGNALGEQTIAFWVVTDDKFTTHLYTADKIVLTFPTDEEQEILLVQEPTDQELDMLSAANSVDINAMRQEQSDARKEEIESATYDLNGNER